MTDLILPEGARPRAAESVEHGSRRVYLTNWWSPVHLFPHGADLRFRHLKSAGDVAKYLEGRRIDLFLMEDNDLVARVVQFQAVSTGQVPDMQNPGLLRAIFEDMARNLIKSVTDAHTREVDKPREVKVGIPFLFLQIVMPWVDPSSIISGQPAPVKCFWFEVTPMAVEANAGTVTLS